MRNILRKLMAGAVALAFCLGLTACGNNGENPGGNTASDPGAVNSPSAAEPYDVYVAGGAQGGQNYRWALAACNIINEHSDIVRANSLTSMSSFENAQLTAVGECDLGIVGSYALYSALYGVKEFEGNQLENLYPLYPVYPDYFYLVLPENSDVNCLADLVGHRVSLDVKSASTGIMLVLEALGYSPYEDYDAVNLGAADSCSAIAEGALDGFFTTGGKNGAAVAELQTTKAGLKIVGLTEEEIATVCEALPYYTPTVMEDSYPGIPPINTVMGYTFLVANETVPEEVGYEIARVLTENHDEFVEAMNLAEFSQIGLLEERAYSEIQPGALAYAQEVAGK